MALDVISFVIRWSAFGNTRNHSIGQLVSVVKMAGSVGSQEIQSKRHLKSQQS